MSRIIYSTLIRDAETEDIRRGGGNPVTSRLPPTDHRYYLILKLLDEAHNAVRSATDPSTFAARAANLLEVLRALSSQLGVRWESIEAERLHREQDLGGFSQGVFLQCVDSHPAKADLQRMEPSTPCLLTRGSVPSLLDVLHRELENSRYCRIATAFCTRGMLNQLIRPFQSFLSRKGRLQILTSVMSDFNDPDDFLHLGKILGGCELRVFYPQPEDAGDAFKYPPPAFHLKSFLFDKLDGKHSIIVGSSNLTRAGLAGNYEWNLYSNSEVNVPLRSCDTRNIYETARDEFDHHWANDSVEITPDFLAWYRPRWERARAVGRSLSDHVSAGDGPTYPRPAQREALHELTNRRRLGIRKAAVIAATGLGKTHLAAFDFQQAGLHNFLFIAHRETILHEAKQVFQKVLGDRDLGVVLAGKAAPAERRLATSSRVNVFATIQTLSRPELLAQFNPHHFGYVVVDEFHHSEAASYRRVLEHFDPDFLLGMTATPERMDGRDVLRLCDYNVAYEARLFDAIEQGWLVPFQYYAIYDETDYLRIRWTGIAYDENELEESLSSDTRAELILKNLEMFLPAAGKVKALAFCATKRHAQFMAGEFSRRGFPAECLLGESPESVRADAIRRLQDELDPLKIICSVDILGEGVNIPAVSHVLMLRPTMSFTVFLQQLGRGLRTNADKEFLVVLDFVGNHRNAYVAPLVLRGYSSLEQYRGRNGKEPVASAPTCCTLDIDRRVQRIWDKEIRRILAPRSRKELLRLTYERMRKELGRAPCLLDFLANPEACDPHALISAFGSWLRTREAMGDLNAYERELVGTAGEGLLQHVERELNPNRSYKMVVLKVLLDDSPEHTEWRVEWIAGRFKDHYLADYAQLGDCSILARAHDPRTVPIARVVALLKSMPLSFLTNTTTEFFFFDRKRGVFAVSPQMHPFWREAAFRDMLKERTLYALARYFMSKGVDLEQYGFDPAALRERAIEDAVALPALATALPFYPALHVAAGVFRGAATEYEAATIYVPDPLRRFNSARHFVVQIDGDSMAGGASPILDGDRVVLERIDASRAGSLTAELAVAVERQDFDDTAYALKSIRKDSQGRYWLHSWNRAYDDVLVDAESMIPFARLICKVPEGTTAGD